MGIVNTEQAEFWASMAPTWVELEARLESTAGLPGRLAMDLLQLEPGQRVMELGCGTGATILGLAERVGPDGTVVGIDIAEEMLDEARRRAADAGARNVTFVHADVQAHDLGETSYDAAFSRFGVMFYSDPHAAFANVRRAIRPGGRLAFVCWQNVFANEWMLVPGMAVMSVTGTPPSMPEPGAPGPFSLCEPERVHSILEAAGFVDLDVSPYNDVITSPQDEIAAHAAVAVQVGAAREALKDADDATKEKAYQAVVDAYGRKVEDGELRLSRGVLLVTARS